MDTDAAINRMTSSDWLEDIPHEEQEAHRARQAVRDEILSRLSRVIDPDLDKDIVSLNFVKELIVDHGNKSVSFTLELTTLACPVKDDFVRQCEDLLLNMDEVEHVDIEITARAGAADPEYAGHENSKRNLIGISNVVAVSSGKGGVGKSTLCINIAYTLAAMGARVGVVDCDVYGPSLPSLVNVTNPQVFFTNTPEEVQKAVKKEVDKGVDKEEIDPREAALKSGQGTMIPLVYKGVKLMSYGFLRPGSAKYAAVRGPLASSLIYQMITQTQWGMLDYLLLDLPPGTGDIHLTIGQSVPLTGAIIVTTPHPLALTDVEKGLHMFTKMSIPPVAVITNMAYLPCPSCKTEIDPLGGEDIEESATYSSLKSIVREFGIELEMSLPLDRLFSRTRKMNPDNEEMIYPFCNFAPEDHPIQQKLVAFCRNLVQELARIRYSGSKVPDLSQDSTGKISIAFKAGSVTAERLYKLDAREIRLRCRCAECVDEFTGRVRVNSKTVKKVIYALQIRKTGNYASTFEWNDGHSSIIPFALLEAMAKEREINGGNNPASSSGGGNCEAAVLGDQW